MGLIGKLFKRKPRFGPHNVHPAHDPRLEAMGVTAEVEAAAHAEMWEKHPEEMKLLAEVSYNMQKAGREMKKEKKE